IFMAEQSPSAEQVLDRMQRIQRLTRGVPFEARVSGQATASLPNQEMLDSPIASMGSTAFEPAKSPVKVTIPTMVHQYQMVSVLGKGGIGVVFKAKDTKLNSIVAL